MKIGIDIDNTLTEVQDELNFAAYKYAKKLGKNLDDSINLLEDINNNGNYYVKKYKFTYEELKFFLKNIMEDITNKAKPREGAVEVIKNLRNEGHKIYIITARDSEFHDDPYAYSKDWLDENNIEYDNLIVNARKKAPVCKEEKIDIFIDDQLGNCQDISKEGINVIRINDKEIDTDENIATLNNWYDIEKYIGEITK